MLSIPPSNTNSTEPTPSSLSPEPEFIFDFTDSESEPDLANNPFISQISRPTQHVPPPIQLSTMAQMTTLQVPMPVPRTANAPHFNKQHVRHFLELIEQHGTNAGITDNDKLVPYILKYSSDQVKKTIRFLPEFDPEEANKTWAKAKEALIDLYGASEEIPTQTLEDLKKFCRERSGRQPFKSREEVDEYRQEFTTLSAHLVKLKRVSEDERNFYFISGLPKLMMEWFIQQLPEANRVRDKPPTVTESVKILYKRLDTNSLHRSIWEENETTQNQNQFNEEGNLVTDKPLVTVMEPLPQVSVQRAGQPSTLPLIPDSYIDDLSRRLTEMTLNRMSIHPPEGVISMHRLP